MIQIRTLFFFAAGLFFAIFSSSLFADYPKQPYWNSTKYRTPEAACQAYVAGLNQTYHSVEHMGNLTYRCYRVSGSGKFSVGDFVVKYNCPYGGTLSPEGMCVDPPPCENGQSRNPETGQCEQGCAAGEDKTIFVQWAKSRTGDPSKVADGIYDVKVHSTYCVDSCQIAVTGSDGGDIRVGVVGPPFAVYGDIHGTTTGNRCTPTDEANSDPWPQDTTCPTGTAPGTVNGVLGCYKVSDTTTEITTTTNPDGSVTRTETSRGPKGETITETTTNPDGTVTRIIRHIGGGAGTAPPSEGSGGYDGDGNGGGGDGQGGDGTGEEPEPPEPCGGPDQPDCNVRINEDGTPDGETAFDAATDNLDSFVELFDGQLQLDSVTVTPGEVQDLFFWNPQLPTGICQRREIFGYSIDICQPLGMARDIWSYVIMFMTMIYVWRRGTSALGGGDK